MRLSLRLDDVTGTALTAAADREGLTVSRFVARAIVRDLTADRGDEPTRRSPVAPLAPSPRTKVYLRMQSRELADLERIAKDAGLSRNQWMLRAIHAVLYDRQGRIRPLPEVRKFCRQLLSTINPVGRNVNQAVTKRSVIATDRFVGEKDREQLLFWVEQLRDMHKQVCAACDLVEDGLSHLAGGNFAYWTGRDIARIANDDPA
ncbi:uncharacterized protein (DUF1778 family) [Sphingomonas endophytica]|uniref:Uncharacterized protein (DUF1778 family) n=1 Tax=Sphingomonas endophytica TaxID=869719 RepID=A0A7X0MQM7_9SPHN|nr:hypothetical protein [Sphingomonas endophytica]MBB6505653.1 uncharacterized protein (DUF1778 family) [Sphingomonas endophytica]